MSEAAVDVGGRDARRLCERAAHTPLDATTQNPEETMSTKHDNLTRGSLAKLATVDLHIEQETIPCEGNFDDPADVEWIHEELKRGNEWAWCFARVQAEYDGCVGVATLGGCSYENRKAFEESNLAVMTSEALDDLWRQLQLRTPAGRAKALALSARQAITTSYRGPTNCRGTRVIARCEAKRVSVSWDDSLDVGANHAAAAMQLMDQLGWSEKCDLVMGGTGDGYVFVQVPKR